MNQLPRRSVTSAFATAQLTQLTGKVAKGETFYASQKNLCKRIQFTAETVAIATPQPGVDCRA